MKRKHFLTVILIAGFSFFVSAQQTERVWEQHPLPVEAGVGALINGIAFDRTGAVWLAINAASVGGFKYIESDSNWTSFTASEHHHYNPDSLPSEEENRNEIGSDNNTCIAIDVDKVWFGAYGHGTSRLSDTTWKHITIISGLASDNVKAIAIIGGTAWVATDKGLTKIIGDSCTKVPITTGNWQDTNIRCLTVDLSGNLWVGNTRGIFKFDGTSWGFRETPVKPVIADNWADALTVDFKGNIWAAIYQKGIYMYDGTTWSLQTDSCKQVSSLAFDKKGHLWVGCTVEGVWEFDGKSSWKHYTTENSLLYSNYVNSVAVDKNGAVWIGCMDGLTKVYDRTVLSIADNKEVNTITIYPNPAKDQFTVSQVEDATVSLYTVSGQKIATYYSSDKDIIIDTNPFEEGLYLLKIEKNNKTSIFKVSIIR